MGTNIEWTDETWNPVSGCTKVSPGCKFCYAEVTSKWLKGIGGKGYDNGFKLTLQPRMLDRPLHWRKPRKIFVNSMSDLFHKDIPDSYIHKVFDVMNQAKQHTFQILTKRPERVLEMDDELDWAPHIWMGVSVENADYIDRINILRKTDAHIKFLSLEPLLGPLPKLNLSRIDWIIVGGESGRNARPMKKKWARDIQKQADRTDTPFFFKQMGGRDRKKGGNKLYGRRWQEFPD